MTAFTDQTGRTISISHFPQRIISLVPSQTELLADLGLGERVVGITKFCVHPDEWFRSKTRVGGTKDIREEVIDSLRPDLIIANKEENEKEQIESLIKKYPVWISDVHDLAGAKAMILSLAAVTGTTGRALQILSRIDAAFDELNERVRELPEQTVCYLIWQEPFLTAGGDTFIHAMLQHARFRNVFGHLTRYPEITLPDIRSGRPQLILLSSEPFPFAEKHLARFRHEFPDSRVELVDGELFSWYGSRLMQSPAYFLNLLERIGTVN